MHELKSVYIDRTGDWVRSGNNTGKFYLKSEADKVIAHHKYKRCLAMAEWCDAESDVADADGDYEDMRWYQKWHQKWMELAEKFKEAHDEK